MISVAVEVVFGTLFQLQETQEPTIKRTKDTYVATAFGSFYSLPDETTVDLGFGHGCGGF